MYRGMSVRLANVDRVGLENISSLTWFAQGSGGRFTTSGSRRYVVIELDPFGLSKTEEVERTAIAHSRVP